MKAFELNPLDTLFFRDARPMEAGAGSGGHGANWPLPTVLHEALRAALLMRSGMPHQPRTHRKERKDAIKEYRVASDLFRSLRTIGPFPAKDGELYLPCPADLVATENGKTVLFSPLLNPPGESNMPATWLRPVISNARVGKQNKPDWIPRGFLADCLNGTSALSMPEKAKLFDTERRIGIGIDSETGAAAEHQIYAAEHLRLRPGVSLWFKAALSDRGNEKANNPVSLDDLDGETVALGGESRLCRLKTSSDLLNCDAIQSPSGRHIKWVLVTPAVFLGGWRPNWVDEKTGSVLLRNGGIMRKSGEDRLSWRKRIRESDKINAFLVAACLPKPVFFSGWDLNLETEKEGVKHKTGGPKPTMLAVPAGSVYYFRAVTDEDGAALVSALHSRTLSDCFGEKGMGLGVCGTWASAEDAGSKP